MSLIPILLMDDEMWELFKEIKDEEDKQIKISNGIDDNQAGEDIIKCECGSTDYLIEDNMHICKKCSSIISKVIENTAKSDAKVMWPKIVTLASKKDCIPRFHRYFDKEGKLLRTLELSDIKTFDKHLVPTVWKMTPTDDSTKSTTITYKNLKFDVKFPNNYFSSKTLTGN